VHGRDDLPGGSAEPLRVIDHHGKELQAEGVSIISHAAIINAWPFESVQNRSDTQALSAHFHPRAP